MTTPNRDPLVRAARKAYRETVQYQVDKLMAEQSRWLRKRTIANNKLGSIRYEIDPMLEELAKEKGQADDKDKS